MGSFEGSPDHLLLPTGPGDVQRRSGQPRPTPRPPRIPVHYHRDVLRHQILSLGPPTADHIHTPPICSSFETSYHGFDGNRGYYLMISNGF
ncbi:hypothetical protein H6P81_006888 [Aristolochia fimbriata]|uniref:Uncharacterized protein n=1 Tax=Aristolochia fimbriata TaxID=158543 RepID=A0AAV7EZX3_ARIFI|nr:hypothetical protein H6P81_006888 [Aristolochia fimbriata]